MKQAARGFTLIELMIVIAIVGILSSIAVPSYRSYVTKSTATGGLSMLQSFRTTVMEDYNLTGSFPSALTFYFNDTGSDADYQWVKWQPSTFSLEIRFGPGAGSLNGGILHMRPDVSNPSIIKWTCLNHVGSSKLPTDALPSECS